MKYDIENIFQPSVGVDIVFDMDSLNPVSRSAIIYDMDLKSSTVTIAQPIVPITSNTRFKQLHMTTITNTGNRRIRIGIPCRPVKFIKHYPLANGAQTQALVMEFLPPPREINIRSAFRLPLSLRHSIKAKLQFKGQEFFTTRDFKFKDISFTGMGLVLPKSVKDAPNPLTTLSIGTRIPFGIILVNKEESHPFGKFPLQTQVVRLNPNYSETHCLAGLKILDITQEHETILNQFIHNAQIAELKRLSQLS
jgi:hypothetical protein